MAGYRINGNECTLANQCKPESHSISQTTLDSRDTIGGTILIEPPGGIKRVHTWHFGALRSTRVVEQLLAFLDLDNSPLVIIDTYDVIRDSTGQDILLTELEVTAQKPEIKSAGRRDRVESFDLVFVETRPQS